MEQHRFRDRPLYVKALSFIFTILVLTMIFLATKKYYIQKGNEDKLFRMRQKNSVHTKIDEIDGGSIYLVIYNKDTAGVVYVQK